MKLPRLLAFASYGCLVAAVPCWVLAFALESDGAGGFFAVATLAALIGFVVLACVGVVAAILWRDLWAGLACALPIVLAALFAVAFVTADWH